MVTLQQLLNDPDFRKLSYAEQVDVKAQLLGPQLQSDPQFAQLSFPERKFVANDLIYGNVALSSPELTEFGNDWISKVMRGDESAINDIGTYAARLGMTQSLTGRAFNFLEERVMIPVVNAVFTMSGEEPISPEYYSAELLKPENQEKMLAAFQSVINTDPKLALNVMDKADWANLGMMGVVADMAVFQKLIGIPIRMAAQAGAGAWAATGSAARWKYALAAFVAPAVAGGIATGTFGTARRIILDLADRPEDQAIMQAVASKGLGEYAKTFGLWVASDVAWSMLANVGLSMGQLYLKMFARSIKMKADILRGSKMTPEQAEETIRTFVKGTPGERFWANMSSEAQDRFTRDAFSKDPGSFWRMNSVNQKQAAAKAAAAAEEAARRAAAAARPVGPAAQGAAGPQRPAGPPLQIQAPIPGQRPTQPPTGPIIPVPPTAPTPPGLTPDDILHLFGARNGIVSWKDPTGKWHVSDLLLKNVSETSSIILATAAHLKNSIGMSHLPIPVSGIERTSRAAASGIREMTQVAERGGTPIEAPGAIELGGPVPTPEELAGLEKFASVVQAPIDKVADYHDWYNQTHKIKDAPDFVPATDRYAIHPYEAPQITGSARLMIPSMAADQLGQGAVLPGPFTLNYYTDLDPVRAAIAVKDGDLSSFTSEPSKPTAATYLARNIASAAEFDRHLEAILPRGATPLEIRNASEWVAAQTGYDAVLRGNELVPVGYHRPRVLDPQISLVTGKRLSRAAPQRAPHVSRVSEAPVEQIPADPVAELKGSITGPLSNLARERLLSAGAKAKGLAIVKDPGGGYVIQGPTSPELATRYGAGAEGIYAPTLRDAMEKVALYDMPLETFARILKNQGMKVTYTARKGQPVPAKVVEKAPVPQAEAKLTIGKPYQSSKRRHLEMEKQFSDEWSDSVKLTIRQSLPGKDEYSIYGKWYGLGEGRTDSWASSPEVLIEGGLTFKNAKAAALKFLDGVGGVDTETGKLIKAIPTKATVGEPSILFSELSERLQRSTAGRAFDVKRPIRLSDVDTLIANVSDRFVKTDLNEIRGLIVKGPPVEAPIERAAIPEGMRGRLEVVNPRTGVSAVGSNPIEIAERVGFHFDKLPAEFAPKYAVTDGSKGRLEITDDAGIVGPRAMVLQEYAQYEDYSRGTELEYSDEWGQIAWAPDISAFELYLPDSEVRINFDSLKEARRALVKWKTNDRDMLEAAARKKGLSVSGFPHEQGSWIVSDGTNTFTGRTPEEFKATLKLYPDVYDAVPELLDEIMPHSDAVAIIKEAKDQVAKEFNLPVETVERMMRDTISYRPSTPEEIYADEAPTNEDLKNFHRYPRDEVNPYAGIKPLGAEWGVLGPFKNRNQLMEDTARKMNDPKLLALYRQAEYDLRLARANAGPVNKAVITLFSEPNGKTYKPDTLQAMYYWLTTERSTPEWDVITGVYGHPNPHQEWGMGQLRIILDKFFSISGMPFDMYVKNYLTRWRAMGVQFAKDADKYEIFTDLLDHHFGESLPKGIKMMFENERTSDVLKFLADDNALRVSHRYINLALKKAYFRDSWEALADHANGLLKEGLISPDSGFMEYLLQYRDEAMGFYRPLKHLEDMGEKLYAAMWDKMPIVRRPGNIRSEFARSGRSAISKLFSVGYLTTMGARGAWLGMRNIHQIFTTLAPKVGTEATLYAINRYNELPDPHQFGRDIGLFSNALPLAHEMEELEGLLDRGLRFFMTTFKSSDEQTRIVAYFAGEFNMNRGIEALRSGRVSTKEEFWKLTHLTSYPRDIRDRAWQYAYQGLQQGDPTMVQGATDLVGWYTSEDTMFPYRTTQIPKAYKGSFIAKMFGQFGTYSAGYRNTIKSSIVNMAETGDRAGIVGYIARLLFNSLFLMAYFNEIGLQSKSFVPGSPALFAGGPLWDIAYLSTKSMALGPRGAQARKQLLQAAARLVPGSMQLHYIRKGNEYADKGDWWRAAISYTATPTDERRFSEGFW